MLSSARLVERIDKLGVTEPTTQKYGLGENQILVELLPDTSRVEKIIQSTAKLAIHAVVGGPYANDQEAIQANNGMISTDLIVLHGSATSGAPGSAWIVKRASEVEGTDFRDAQPGTDQNGRPNVHFNLTTEAGERFYKYISEHVSGGATLGSMAIVLDNKVIEAAEIISGIRTKPKL